MLDLLVAFFLLAGVAIVQSAVLSRMPLLLGIPDLLLLVLVSWALQPRVRSAWLWAAIGGLWLQLTTALPVGVTLAAYLAVTGLALLLRGRIWKAPLLMAFLVTFIGTLIIQVTSALVVSATGNLLPAWDVLNLALLPSLVLNLLLLIPVYALVRDLARWLYPDPDVVNL